MQSHKINRTTAGAEYCLKWDVKLVFFHSVMDSFPAQGELLAVGQAAHCLLTIGLLLCQNHTSWMLLSGVITHLLGMESNSPGRLSPSRTRVTVPHVPVEHGAAVTVPCRWAVELCGTGLCPSDCSTRLPAGILHFLIQNVSPPVPLSFLSASGGVWVGLGCAAPDQQERAGRVLR